jgi:hypothetical protein
MDKRARVQDNDLTRKLIVLVSIALALLVTFVCIVDIILMRRRMAVQPTPEVQVIHAVTAEPKSIPTMAPPTQSIPATLENTPTTVPTATNTPPPATTWRFLRINADNIGTFQNTAATDQRLLAKCIDPNRPPPNKGALYTLDDSGILKLQNGSKKYQRFKVTPGQ